MRLRKFQSKNKIGHVSDQLSTAKIVNQRYCCGVVLMGENLNQQIKKDAIQIDTK